MPILGAIIVPRPPLIIPAVGRGEERGIQATIDAYQKAARLVASWRPEVLIVTTPHLVMYSDYFHISPGLAVAGDMSRFGAPQERIETRYDAELRREVIALAEQEGIDSVLLPTMAKAQDDRATVKGMTRRAIKTSTYIMAPMMIGLAMCAEPAVELVLTAKWLPCVPFLRIFCIGFIFQPIHTANLNAIKALGRSDFFLKLEIIKKKVGLGILLSSMWFGVMAMAYSTLLANVLSQIINPWPNKKLLNYPYLEQLKDILPGILLALGMGAVVYSVQLLGLSDWATILIQVPLGAVLYIAGSKLFHLESFEYVLGIAKGYLHKNK